MKEKKSFISPEIDVMNIKLDTTAGPMSPTADPKDTDPYTGEIDHNT